MTIRITVPRPPGDAAKSDALSVPGDLMLAHDLPAAVARAKRLRRVGEAK